MKFVAVTSCPTGIAHTYMAAEALEQAAKAAGHEIAVETQGSGGFSPLDPAVIAAADAVIFAADVEVRDKARFAGKPTVTAPIKQAVNEPGVLIVEAADLARSGVVTSAAPASPAGGLSAKDYGQSHGARVRGWLMTGVSYMIPFVAAGGLLIALSFMLSQVAWGSTGVVEVTKVPLHDLLTGFNALSLQDWSALMFQVGVAAFGFLVPILAGFIAFAIADRPGIAPGVVGGALAVAIGSGFLGGIVAGFLGGFIALWVSRWKVPTAIRSIMPVVLIPLVSTFLVGLIMVVILGRPLASVATGLASWLNGLAGGSAVLLGVILGLMMAFDMGGPVNKVAYTFATAGLAAVAGAQSGQPLVIMATVMAAGMVPPLALALASTILRPSLFSEAERENGKAAWLLGASFITEGAIPFAAADPIRVIPSIMAGSALTGGLVMAFGNTLRAPHGGIWVTPLVGNPVTYLIAIAAGTVLAAFLVVALKSWRRTPEELSLEAAADDMIPTAS